MQHEKSDFKSGCGAFQPARGFGKGNGDFERGQANFKYGSAFGAVVTGDLPLVVLDYAVGGAESEPCAFAHRLGGVEKIEDALGIAQSGAGVGELDDDLIAFAPDRNLHTPAADFLQCVHGVFDDLNKGLQKLVGVAQDARQGGVVIALHGQADLPVFELESFHLNGALQESLQFEGTFFSWSLLGKAEQIADQFASAPGLLADLLRIGELLAAEVAAASHPFGVVQDGRERELQFAGGERDQFSQRSQLGLLNHSSLQPLEVVETLARMLEQLQKPLVQEVLFEENDKGQEGDAAHGHRKANLAQIKLVVAQEQRPIYHDGEREQGEFRKL